MSEDDAQGRAGTGPDERPEPPVAAGSSPDPLPAPAPLYGGARPAAPAGPPPGYGQAPGSAAPAGPPAAPAPVYGQPPQAGPAGPAPAYGQPQQPGQYGAPQQYGQPAPGGWGGSWDGPTGYTAAPGAPAAPWMPPAVQPGIIPLRPLNLGEILDGAFRSIRANPKVMFGLAAIVVSVAVLVGAVLEWYVGGLIAAAVAGDLVDSGLGTTQLVGQSVGTLVSQPLTALATTVLTGLLIVSVSRSVLGRTASIGEVLRQRRVWLVVGFSLLVGLASVLAVGVVAGAVVLLARADQVGAAVAVGVVGAIALFVGLVWVGVRTLLVPPALMLEGRAMWPTVRRAWVLTRGSWWRLFGIYLLVSILVGFAASIVTFPVGIVAGLAFPDPLSFGYLALVSLGEIVSLTLTTTFMAATVALLYIDVRMRREGLDVELARAAGADG